MGGRPLIIGHRGASALAPENTLAAFGLALRDGADGIEFDVQLARDKVPVVIHDATLSRTGNISRLVADLSSQELSKIEVGSWFNRKFPQQARREYQGEKLCTLRRVFEFLSRSPCLLYLEIKCEDLACQTLVGRSIELIQEYSFKERTIVECFNLAALAQVKRLDAGIRTAALFESRFKQPTSMLKRMTMIDKALDCGADEIALHHTLVTQRVVDRATQSHLPCIVWTVDQPRWVRRAASLGLKALITNNPAAMFKKGKSE